MEKEYKNKIQKLYKILWRKIDSNYHICSANTTDYHYQISPLSSLLDLSLLQKQNKGAN